LFLSPPATTSTPPLSLHDALPIYSSAKSGLPPIRTRSPCGRERSPIRAARRTSVSSSVRGGMDTIPRHSGRRSTSSRRAVQTTRSEEHTSELQSPYDLVCRLLLEK